MLQSSNSLESYTVTILASLPGLQDREPSTLTPLVGMQHWPNALDERRCAPQPRAPPSCKHRHLHAPIPVPSTELRVLVLDPAPERRQVLHGRAWHKDVHQNSN